MTIREYSIDFNDPEQAARTSIRMWKDGLIQCRGKSPQAEELEWEIRLYEFMEKDPVVRLKQYENARMPGDKPSEWLLIPKREVVAKLGWDVP